MKDPPVLCCTSNMDPRLSLILSTLGLEMDFARGSYELGFEKPDRRVFDSVRKEAEKRLGSLRPEECLHVGDDLVKDFEGAKKAGWKAVLLRRNGREDGDGDEVVQSLDEVVRIVVEERREPR